MSELQWEHLHQCTAKLLFEEEYWWDDTDFTVDYAKFLHDLNAPRQVQQKLAYPRLSSKKPSRTLFDNLITSQLVQQKPDYSRPGFNQLPDELVALFASHVDCVDMPKFLQTEKRVLRIVKRYNVDKPALKKIVLNFKKGACPQVTCMLQGRSITITNVFKMHFRAAGKPLLYHITSHVRWTESLEITKTSKNWQLDNVTAAYLIAMSKYIGKLILPSSLKNHLSPDNFVNFCGNFKLIDFQKNALEEKLMCDEVLCKIVELNVVDEFLPTCVPYSTINVTDRLLESIVNARRFCQFSFEICKTSFSVRGIRRFVEIIIGAKKKFHIHFGDIPAYEKDAALSWLQEVVNNHELPYRMDHKNNSFGVYCNYSYAKFDVRRDLA